MRVVACAVLLACGLNAESRLNLTELIEEARRSNPELRAAQKRLEAARQRPRQEGALADPMISAGYKSSGSPLPGAGIGREPVANAGVMVTQELPYPGKRRLMSAAAGKEAGAALEQYRMTERSIVARIKTAFHRLNHAYEAIDVMREGRELLTHLIKLTEVRYSVGKAMQQDIFKTQAQLALMETRIVRMQQDLAMASSELNSLVHRRVGTPLERPDHDTPRPLVPTLEELIAAAEVHSPAIVREQRMTEARQLQVELARKNFYPDFAVSGGYYNMGSMPDMYEFRVDVKLPVWRSKQRAALAEQRHSLDAARSSYDAMAQETRQRVNELYLAAQASWRLMELYTDSVIPAAALSAQSAMASYEAGTGESREVLMNLMSRTEQEERYHEEMLNYFTALVRLEELTGLEIAQ